MSDRRSRHLLAALACSLGLHLSLLLSWRYGEILAPGILQSKTQAAAPSRLDVTLAQPTAHAAPETADGIRAVETAPLPPMEAVQSQATAAAPATSAAPGIPMDALYYYSVPELDQRPILKRDPVFEPASDAQLLANGSALLELLIEKDGHVNTVNIVRTDLLELHLEPLRRAFSTVEYTPGIKQGRTVRSRIYIEVRYVDGVASAAGNASSFPDVRTPQTPLQLPPDWRKPKQNPPSRNTNHSAM